MLDKKESSNKVVQFVKEHKTKIIAVLIVIILLVLWNKHGYKLMRLFKPDVKNTAPEPLSDVRKFQIEEHMKLIKNDIDDVTYSEWVPTMGHDTGLYHELLGWYDDEIIYAADYYKNFLAQGKSFYSDLKGEHFFWSDVNNRVLDKLKELNKI